MLRFSTTKILADRRDHPLRLPARRAEPALARASARRSSAVGPGWVPSWVVPTQGDHARPRPAGRLARPARGRPGRSPALHDRPACATTCAASCARPACRSRAASSRCRAACSSASPRPPSASGSCRSCASCRSRSATRPRPDGRPRPRRRRAAGRPDPAHLHRAGVTERTRRAAEQAIEVSAAASTRSAPPSRHPAPGRRPHPRPGAGPAGPAAPEGAPRPDREARVPHGRRAGARPTSTCCPRRDAERPAHPGRAAHHRRGRGPHRRPARLRPADQPADRQLPLQHPRRPALRAGDDRERRPRRSPSCSTTR